MMTPTEVVEHKGRPYQGQWSGEESVPDVGQEVTGIFGNQRVPAVVTGYFTEGGFLGCRVRVFRLPADLHNYPDFVPGGREATMDTWREYVASPDAFTAYLFGSELEPPLPRGISEHDALEEFAVLVAAASYGRNTWRHHLQDCWLNGTYNRYCYNWLRGELQRIRNGAGWTFVNYVVKRHAEWIKHTRP